MFTRIFILSVLLATPLTTPAQPKADPDRQKKESAVASVDVIIGEAAKLDDKLAIVNLTARAASLVSYSDPLRAEALFVQVWKFAKDQTDEQFDKQRAAGIILKYLFPRNPKLAKQLSAEEIKTDESSLQSRASGRDENLIRAGKLATQLADVDPRAASELLERTLSVAVTPAGLNALAKLREQDSLMSDFVVAKVMETLKSQPDIVSLSGLNLLSAYLFPDGGVELTSSLQSLQIQYFSAAYDALKTSLSQAEQNLVKDQRYTPADLRFRGMYQARVALTLAALAPRYRPDLVAELQAMTNKTAGALPDNVAQLARLNAARLAGQESVPDNPEAAIPLTIMSGDFAEAGRLIDNLKSEAARKSYTQMLAKVEAKALLKKGDVMAGLTRIRQVEDQSARLILYLEAAKAAEKKHDPQLSTLVINEARTLIPQVARNGLHVRALLTFASQMPLSSRDEAADFLGAAVAAINALPKVTDESSNNSPTTEAAWRELNDPRSLLDAPEFDRAFSSIGANDLARAAVEAGKLELKSLQLAARLEAQRDVLTVDRKKPKPASKPAPVLPP